MRTGWLLLLAMCVSCDALAQATGCDDLRGRPIVFAVDYATQIKPIINEMVSPTGRCTSCHGGTEFLNLTDSPIDAIYRLVSVTSALQPERLLVDAGSPSTSFFFEKLNCTFPAAGERMPRDGVPLTLEEQELFFDWIAQGARGEPIDKFGEAPRDFLFRDGAESLRFY